MDPLAARVAARFKSKFKNGDRVKFTGAGPKHNQTGTVVHVRTDGLLVVHFDHDPKDSILVVEPSEVAPV